MTIPRIPKSDTCIHSRIRVYSCADSDVVIFVVDGVRLYSLTGQMVVLRYLIVSIVKDHAYWCWKDEEASAT